MKKHINDIYNQCEDMSADDIERLILELDDLHEDKTKEEERLCEITTNHKTNPIIEKPCWICLECGNKYGKSRGLASTYHEGVCEICKIKDFVTEARDYGYPDFPKKEDLICVDCGNRLGKFKPVAHFERGACSFCGRYSSVTEKKQYSL